MNCPACQRESPAEARFCAYFSCPLVPSWFSEGFDTQDLKDAKALLEELRA